MGWKRSLLGGHVKLPLKDSQGVTLPQGHSLLVVTVSCSSCTSSAFLETLERSRIKPAIIVSLDGLAAIPKTILKRPKSYLILGDKNKYSLPSDMIRFAPQVATIDKHGKIIEIPGETTTFEEYIS